MICKPDSILDDIWSKVKAVCIDYDLPDELRILKVMLRNKMSTGFCICFDKCICTEQPGACYNEDKTCISGFVKLNIR